MQKGGKFYLSNVQELSVCRTKDKRKSTPFFSVFFMRRGEGRRNKERKEDKVLIFLNWGERERTHDRGEE